MRDELLFQLKCLLSNWSFSQDMKALIRQGVERIWSQDQRIADLEAEKVQLKNRKPDFPCTRLAGFTEAPRALVLLFGPSECHAFGNANEALLFHAGADPSRTPHLISLVRSTFTWHTKETS